MAKSTMALAEYLRKTGMELESGLLRDGIALLTRLLMEAQVSEQIGAGRYEHRESRQGFRNGCRDGPWETRVGEIPLQIPELRRGSDFQSFLEPPQRGSRRCCP
jgi:transposase-like protein